MRNKSIAVSGSIVEACPIKAAAQESVSLKKRSKNLANLFRKGRKIKIDKRFIKLEKVTNPINGSLIFRTSVIKLKSSSMKMKDKLVIEILKTKLPSATRFFVAFPFEALKMIYIIVPVSAPNTIAAAGGKLIAPACNALNVSAIVAELD